MPSLVRMLHDLAINGVIVSARRAYFEPVEAVIRACELEGVEVWYTQHYPEVIRPALQVIPIREGLKKVCGVYVLITPQREIYFLVDATVNIEPSEEDLAEIALGAAEVARRFNTRRDALVFELRNNT